LQKLDLKLKHRISATEVATFVMCAQFFSWAPAQAELAASNPSPRQGETVELVLHSEEPHAAPASIHFNGRSIKVFKKEESDAYQCLLAIPADIKPGSYKVSCGQDSLTLNVKIANFPVQRLQLPPSKNNFLSSPGEQEAIEAAKQTLTPVRFWDTNFMAPSDARVSSVFGIRRVVNGKLLPDYFHSGVDYAASLGSPVKATAPGVVVLARTGFKLHGNVVMIDHGQGVISIYIHMQKVLVEQGQHVQAGQIIGKVGQTGRANGPHLHFSLYVNDVATNPVAWYHHSF
jgi:lysostaphin